MKLSDGKVNKTYIVEGINLEHELKRRLEVLGLTGHSQVLVLNYKKNGSMIIKVRGTRFATGRKIAEGITVDELS